MKFFSKIFIGFITVFFLVPTANSARAVSWFPAGNLVQPPQADPRAPRNSLLFYLYEDEENQTNLLGAEGALTHNFGIARWQGEEGLTRQLTMEAGVFSMFQESPDDYELVSADYHIGFPLEISADNHEWRFELYHVSSHLGDEFSERTDQERISFSYESLKSTYFWNYSAAGRVFGGGEYIFNITPDKGRWGVHGGATHNIEPWFLTTYLSTREYVDWEPSVMLQGGRYFGRGNPLSLSFFYHRGPIPIGQFYAEERDSIGFYIKFNPRGYCPTTG